MRVLIGVDGSDGAFAAVRFVGRLLSPERDEVIFYYAPPQLNIRGKSPGAGAVERANAAMTAAVFEESAARLPEPLQSQVQTVVGTKDPPQGLAAVADEQRADLIVVGAHGVRSQKGQSLGSVGRAVVHATKVPVLVVRGPKPDREGAPLRVVLARDHSPSSRAAGELLGKFTWPEGSTGTVATVIESMFAGDVPAWLIERARDADTEAMAKAWVEEHEAEKRQKTEELARFSHVLSPIFHAQSPVVAEGPAAQRIVELLRKDDADLVALGAHGKGLVERFFVGSVSESVLQQAPCSVLIVREK